MPNVKHVIYNDVINWLDETELPEEALIYDPELNRLLDSIRTTRPVHFRCGASECQTILAYWGLTSGGQARVVPGPKRKPRGKRSSGTIQIEGPYRPGESQPKVTQIRGGAADLVFPDFGREQRFDEAIEYGMKGEGTIRCEPNPDVGSGWPLRWEFVCPGPGPAHYEYTNSEMLRMFARAVGFGQDTIRPDRLW